MVVAGALTKGGVQSLAEAGPHCMPGISDEYDAPVGQLGAVQAAQVLRAVDSFDRGPQGELA